jgi:hypothetical protein
MTNAPRVVALVAARNEAATIRQVVRALLATGPVAELWVAADGSTDDTAEQARAAGARVITARASRGKGGALEALLDRVSAADVYLLVDGDVGETAGAAAVLLEPVLAGNADLAVGTLPASVGGGFGLVKRTARALIGASTGFEAAEPLSGQRAVTRRALQACRPLAAGFGVETAMTFDAARLGLRIAEVPVAMSHRATGRGAAGFAHRAGQGLDILRAALPRLAGWR